MTTLFGSRGQFVNAKEGEGFDWVQVGVKRRLGIFPRVQWEFRLNPLTPLTWHDVSGFWQPDCKRITDGGSVPSLIRPFLPEAQFPASYSFHDCAWSKQADGRIGLYRSAAFAGPYEFCPLTRRQSNTMLQAWIETEGGGAIARAFIGAGVGLGRLWR